MHRTLIAIALICCLGAGCGKSPDRDPVGPKPVTVKSGIALVTKAYDTGGQPIAFTDAAGRWTLKTLLPPTIKDVRGAYAGPKEGEIITVQLGVSGNASTDRDLMANISGLESFEDGTLGAWAVTAAHETTKDRWVIRARLEEPNRTELTYHVIECRGVTRSERGFWDGCRSFIMTAHVGYAEPSPWSATPSVP
jgi:hypothetical protein